MPPSDDETATIERELTVIEGGRHLKKHTEHADARARAKNAGGLFITTRDDQEVGIVWPQLLGTLRQGDHTLVIIASFCIVTLHGSGMAEMRRLIFHRKISEIREGDTIGEARIEKITIEQNNIKHSVSRVTQSPSA